MFTILDYKVKTSVTTESFKKFIKYCIDHDVLSNIDQGIFRFNAQYIIDCELNNDEDSKLAIWNWMGTLRLVDYSQPGAYSKKSGDWPIITDIYFSKEVNNTIVILTADEPKDYELGDGVRKALEVSEEE